MFLKVFGDSSILRATVFQWRSIDGMVCGEWGVDWRHRVEQKAGNNENNARVTVVLKDDHCVSCRMIAERTGIPKTIVHRILSDDLKKQKLFAQFMLHALTAEQREQRVVHAKDLTIPIPSWFESARLFCISEVENGVEGDWYATISNIQTSVTMKLKTIPMTDFSQTTRWLEDRTNQCIAVNGDYLIKKFV